MLNYFVRNLTYFQTVRNNREMNTGYIYDNEFAKIQSYINDKILPTISSLIDNRIHGPLGSDGYLLRNIGNRITMFDRVRDSDIADVSISLDRISKIVPNSIIYCDVGDLTAMPCTELNTTLVNSHDMCSFKKIGAVNIRDRSITSSKVALRTLTLAHIVGGALNPLINIPIATSSIADKAIDEVKLADKSITKDKLNEVTLNLRDNLNLILVKQVTTNLVNDTHIVKRNHIADNSVDFNLMFRDNKVLLNACLPVSAIIVPNEYNISPYRIFYNDPITNDHIKDGSFAPIIFQNANQGINKYKLCAIIRQKLIVGGLVV